MKIAALCILLALSCYALGYAHASRKGRAATQLCVEILQRSVKTYSSTDAVCRHFVIEPWQRAPQVTP